MALIDDFKARFSEFDTSIVDTYLPILEPVYPAYYAAAYDDTNALIKEATLNLLAHMLTAEIDTDTDAARSVSSQSVGSVSVSYEAHSGAGGALYDAFNTTKYGQRFLLITAHHHGGMSV